MLLWFFLYSLQAFAVLRHHQGGKLMILILPDDAVERQKLGVNKERTTVALKGFIWSISPVRKWVWSCFNQKLFNLYTSWGNQMKFVCTMWINCGEEKWRRENETSTWWYCLLWHYILKAKMERIFWQTDWCGNCNTYPIKDNFKFSSQ